MDCIGRKIILSSTDKQVIEMLCKNAFARGYTLNKAWEERIGFWFFGVTEYYVSLNLPEPSKEEQLMIAIHEERYEDAAILRDQLNIKTRS